MPPVCGLATLLTLLVLVILRVGIAAGSPAVGTPPVFPYRARCQASELRATFSLIPFSQGAGQIYYELTVTNHSAFTCTLIGPFALRLLGARGKALPTHPTTAPPGTYSVELAAGQWAQAQAKFSPDVPGPGENGRVCEPTAHALQVTIDGGTLTAPMDPTPVCEHGSMYFERLAPVAVVPACRASWLAATFSDNGTKTAAGTLGYYLKLRNDGGRACFADTYVGLRLLASARRPLPTHVSAGVNSPLVVPADTLWEAYALVDTEQGSRIRFGGCEPIASGIRISPSAGSGSLTVSIQSPVSVCHNGAIDLSGLYQSG
jgi:hypothetical protein